MAGTLPSDAPRASQPRWYLPTPGKFLFAVLVIQGVLFLSAQYRWFWFNERKGHTVLIAVAATVIALLILAGFVLVSRFFKSKAQFSLATLLLMVPVLGVPLGWLAREMDLAKQQRDAVGVLHKSHANAYVQRQPVRENISYGTFQSRLTLALGEDFFSDAVYLHLHRGTDSDLQTVRNLKGLQALVIAESAITDEGLAQLKALPQLTVLHMNKTPVTDAGLEHLQSFGNLNQLVINNMRITDSGLERVAGFAKLQVLELENTEVTDAGLEKLHGLKDLRELNLEGTKVTDEGVMAIGRALPEVQIKW